MVLVRERAGGTRDWKRILGLVLVYGVLGSGAGAVSAAEGTKDAGRGPDVFMIIVDDLNDWISLLDPAAPIQTPSLDRLAERGMTFTRAYCASPACNPSRTATLTGLRPSSSGVYGNRSDWRKAVGDRWTLMQRFRREGYHVAGAGKVFHHHLEGAFHDPSSFDVFSPMKAQLYPQRKLNGAPEYGSRNTDWGPWPRREEDAIDFQTVTQCIAHLNAAPNDVPLMLVCGIFKPHSPFFAPEAFHQDYQRLQPPPRREDDWDDLPSGAEALMKRTRWFWTGMQRVENRSPGAFRKFVQAYASCAAFADRQIGRLLNAIDQHPRGEDAVIVLWSDHGFHLGEKDHIEKFGLWEKSTRVPLIISAPGTTRPGSRCERPVDLVSIYPTLLDLCGIGADSQCDGVSLRPLLQDAQANWERPALMTYGRGNHAVRSQRWRLIHYADGSEEFYDHRSDPNEWKNLAGDPRWSGIREQLRRWIPSREADAVGDLKRPATGRVR